ncbi:MAG: arsenite methyltransferase [Bacteroidales bacterium]
MKPSDLKLIVKEKYGKVAVGSGNEKGSCCCTPGCCTPEGYTVFSEDYSHLPGYNSDADLSLGCGIPVEYASIIQGDTLLDLGSGAGNDCFVARALVGENGHVTGIDFTEEMLSRAESNRQKLGYSNIKFVKGDIEEMPLPDNSYDVVVSNCVLNLVPDKQKAFSEILRVLKPGGHFCVSDVVIRGTLTDSARTDADLYAGCVAGASTMDEYLGFIRSNGFTDIMIHKEKRIEMPDVIVSGNAGDDESGIYSITVSAGKPHITG